MSHFLRSRWFLAGGLALLLIAVAGAFFYVRRPQFESAARLAGLLPRSEAAIFYTDLGLLRRGGVLQKLGDSASEEGEYRQFVAETGFIYQRDLDALAVAMAPNQIFAALHGRFNWRELREYAKHHGGECREDYCRLPASQPGRWISFLRISNKVMGLAVSSDPAAAYNLAPREGVPDPVVPAAPVWAQIPHRVLEHPETLPAMLQVFASALSNASLTTVTLQPEGSDLGLQLTAECNSAAAAQTVRDHVFRLTGMFRSLAAGKGTTDSPTSLARLLASGELSVKDQQMQARWRISWSFLDSLLSDSESKQ